MDERLDSGVGLFPREVGDGLRTAASMNDESAVKSLIHDSALAFYDYRAAQVGAASDVAFIAENDAIGDDGASAGASLTSKRDHRTDKRMIFDDGVVEEPGAGRQDSEAPNEGACRHVGIRRDRGSESDQTAAVREAVVGLTVEDDDLVLRWRCNHHAVGYQHDRSFRVVKSLRAQDAG